MNDEEANDDIPTNLDWSKAERGKFALRLKGKVAVITVQGDLARALEDASVQDILEDYLRRRNRKADGKRADETAAKNRFSSTPRGNLTGSGDLVVVPMIDEEVAYQFDSTDEIEQALREYLARKAEKRRTA